MSASLLMQSSQQTIVAAASTGHHRSTERRMASLAGATASRVSNTSFTVAVDMLSSSSSCNSNTSAAAVMDVVGNPDMLPLWCDAIPSLVVTSSSEGARNAANHHLLLRQEEQSRPNNRQYEGEWMEATTTRPLVPPHRTSCWFYANRWVRAAMGFPSYGKIDMFVERQRGQVGLTIGPFAGGIYVSHKLLVEPVYDSGKVRISNEVQLKQANDNDDWSFCGVGDILSRAFLPTVDDYMDQVLSSMARLRFLVEQGEVSGYSPPTFDEEMQSTSLLDGARSPD
jgi:hypothetical protein